MKKLGLYIHIPFCRSKCNYCDFLSFALDEETLSSYILKLKDEIGFFSSYAADYIVDTIYIGGGTPSIIEAKYIYELLDMISKKYNLSSKFLLINDLGRYLNRQDIYNTPEQDSYQPHIPYIYCEALFSFSSDGRCICPPTPHIPEKRRMTEPQQEKRGHRSAPYGT